MIYELIKSQGYLFKICSWEIIQTVNKRQSSIIFSRDTVAWFDFNHIKYHQNI